MRMGAVVLVGALAGCGDGGGGGGGQPASGKITAAPDLSGKADGALTVRPLGRLEGQTERRFTLAGEPVSFRFRTFPGTKVRIELSSPDGELDPYLSVLGPIPGSETALFAYNDDATADDFASALDITAEQFGAFEVVAGTYGLHHLGEASAGDLVLRFRCLEGCEQPQIPLEALLQGVDQAALSALLSEAVPAFFVDAELSQAVLAQADALLDGTSDGPFPVLPMAALTAGQALFEAPDHAVDPPAPVTFVLEELPGDASSALTEV